ncbi:hypothetical protein [uncultured Pseudacidovorax sp.]|uniref:hypothetical protein n=1 Tax=uncultured Pseudacidovorax sp. TaxID=679313 RepID=UPI0025FB9269|nr:hypothetical protein [uncultured Pseudacidovorax sp.]
MQVQLMRQVRKPKMHKFLNLLILIFPTLLSLHFIAEAQIKSTSEFQPRIDDRSNTAYRYKYSHTINGYITKCDRKMLLVWGMPKILSRDSPQATQATLIDLTKKRKTKTFYFGAGTYGAGFLKDGRHLYVETGTGDLIDLKTRKQVETGPNAWEFQNQYESCPDFKGRHFSKY